MINLFLVGLGGFLGAITRFKFSGLILHRYPATHFPLGTMVVNISGCLLIGLIAGLAERHHMFSPEARLFLITGVLGGYTTFSAFGFETIFLLREGKLAYAATNVLLSVFLGLVAVWAGLKLGEMGPSSGLNL